MVRTANTRGTVGDIRLPECHRPSASTQFLFSRMHSLLFSIVLTTSSRARSIIDGMLIQRGGQNYRPNNKRIGKSRFFQIECHYNPMDNDGHRNTCCTQVVMLFPISLTTVFGTNQLVTAPGKAQPEITYLETISVMRLPVNQLSWRGKW